MGKIAKREGGNSWRKTLGILLVTIPSTVFLGGVVYLIADTKDPWKCLLFMCGSFFLVAMFVVGLYLLIKKS